LALELGLSDQKTAGLSPAAEALKKLLTAEDRSQAERALIEQDDALLDAFERLSPLAHLDGLRAPLFLFHSESDQVMPWEHSAELAEAAPAGGRLEVSRLLHHTRLVLDRREWRLMLGYPREAWDLIRWMDAVLEAAGV
jgi:hypothetical protein